jgi:hypothetical protein
MSYEPVPSGDLRSHIDKFAPNTTTIDDFKAEEFPSSDPGILAEFQGGNKRTSTAGGVKGMSREDIVIEDDVVRHDLLVCQPCDEDENVVVAAILAEYKGGNKSTSTAGGVKGLGSDQLFCQPCDEDENVEVVAEGKTNSRSKKRKRGMTMEYYDDNGDDNDENVDSWNGDGNGVTWHLCEDCDYKAKQRSHLKTHRALIHNENVTWHKCEDCDYKTKHKGSLKRHCADIHNEHVTWHYCKDCDYKAKQTCTLKQHRAAIHNENVTWHYCKDCDYKSKHKGNLKSHRANIHK